MFRFLCFMLLMVLTIMSCTSNKKIYTTSPNPAAAGFNAKDSDAKAIELADSVMYALGGRKSWDNTRYIRWNFFGSRVLFWDKYKNRVRIESKRRDMKILLNMNDMSGKVWLDGSEATQPDTIQKYLQKGYEIWVNDAYWLVMPFKLKDDGVTLKYLGMQETSLGIQSHVLSLTFNKVGVTPENKYHIWISPTSYLVTQWAFFDKASDKTPSFTTPWTNYNGYGNIVLASGRGKETLYDIAVWQNAPETAFTNFDAVKWAELSTPPKKKKKK